MTLVVGDNLESLKDKTIYQVEKIATFMGCIRYHLSKVWGTGPDNMVIPHRMLKDFQLVFAKTPTVSWPEAQLRPWKNSPAKVIPVPKSLEDWYRKSMKYVVRQ